MNENPLVSIIITTCKREMDILERAIKSAVEQTYENKEIIVVNDWPEYREKTEELLKGYPEISFINNNSEHGVSFVRNIGLREAEGKYIAFLDDDDEWMPDKIEKQVGAADENTGIVYCEIRAIRNESELKCDETKRYPEGKVFRELLAYNFIGGCSAVLFLKQAAFEAGGFDTQLSFGEDYDLWLRISKKYEVRVVREKLVKYYIGHESLTGIIERRISGWEYMLEKYNDDYRRYPNAYTRFTSIIVQEAAKKGSFRYAFGIYRKYGNIVEMIKGIVMKMMGIY